MSLARLIPVVFLTALLPAQDPVAIDKRHYTVALDNSRVRVLSVHYAPGEGSEMHEHTAGVRIFLTDIHNRFSQPDGSTSEATRRAGEIIWSEPVRHGNVNVGKNAVEIIELEIKGLPRRPARAAASAAPIDPSETVVLENEFVRVFRMKIAGHSKSTMHPHSDRVVVAMNDQHSRLILPNGAVEERRRARGQVFWAAVGTAALENLAAAPLENVIVELK